jgi:hypothetical protein
MIGINDGERPCTTFSLCKATTKDEKEATTIAGAVTKDSRYAKLQLRMKKRQQQ